MRRQLTYAQVKFEWETLQEALDALLALRPKTLRISRNTPEQSLMYFRQVVLSAEELADFDTDDAFADAYAGSVQGATYTASWLTGGITLAYHFTRGGSGHRAQAEVSASAPNAATVASLLGFFRRARDHSSIVPEQPTIFIGHGRSGDWLVVKEALEADGYEVVAFETIERAGLSIQAVLQDLLAETSMAFLVHTGEDEEAGRTHALRARQNVVHETGLFQGALGFARAIVIREVGCKPFTNVSGLIEIRYSTGHVEEALPRIRAAISREFQGL